MDQWLLKTLMGVWIGQETLERYQHLNWEQAIQPWQQPELILPDYAAGCVEDWLKCAEFVDVQSQHLGLIHQITTGSRPTR